MKVKIKEGATIAYIQELSKHFDIVVEDGQVYITSIMKRKECSHDI